jgi:hypothetical protein
MTTPTRLTVSATIMDATQRRYNGNLLHAITGTPGMTQRGVNLGPRGPQIERILETYVPDLIWEAAAVLDYLQRTDAQIGDRIQAMGAILRSDREVPLALSVDLHPATVRVARAWDHVNYWRLRCPPDMTEADWPYVSFLIEELGEQAMNDLLSGYLDRQRGPGECPWSPRWVWANRALAVAWQEAHPRRTLADAP